MLQDTNYNASYLSANRQILTKQEKIQLHQLSKAYSLQHFLSDNRHCEELMVDFVYTSAKIEGNTYTRADTDGLLRMGYTAGGKKYSDAVMLVNLRNAFDSIMAEVNLAESSKKISVDSICDMHKILMRDLLPSSEQGLVRMCPVKIGGTRYRPLTSPNQLRTEIKFIVSELVRYTDPFEKAIYLHCNLAYLQYFKDGNKRCARMMQTASLVQDGILPLFFQDTLIAKYRDALIHYYETGDYAPYTAFFIENYQSVVQEMCVTNDEDLISPRQK